MKRIARLPLLVKILIAIGLGIGAGHLLPIWAARIFITVNSLFSNFLGFLIPLIIVGFVAPAIADTGRRAGKMLLATAGLAYGFTLMAGVASYFTSASLFPSLITPGSVAQASSGREALAPYFEFEIEPLFGVTTALVLAFTLGLGIAFVRAAKLHAVASEMRDVVQLVIAKVIIPLLPLYIFGIFMNMTWSGQVAGVMGAFLKIVAVIFAIHVLILLVQYGIAGAVARRNPLALLRGMLPAYFTALGTQSSAATIPVTLRQTVKLGASDDIAGFTVPLCATIHLSGSTLKIVACALAIMLMQGLPFDTPMMLGFIALLGVTMVAAPGVPGGAIMASLGLLSSMLGFSPSDQALMVALYVAMDSFATACNVTGDGAISIIINRYFSASPEKPESESEPEIRMAA